MTGATKAERTRSWTTTLGIPLGILSLVGVVEFPTLGLALGLIVTGMGLFALRRGANRAAAAATIALGVLAVLSVLLIVLLLSHSTSGTSTT
jgi:hypothetical protein